MKIIDFVEILDKEQTEKEKIRDKENEARNLEKLRLEKIENDFKLKSGEFTVKINQGFTEIVNNSDGKFTFQELPNYEDFYSNDEEQIHKIKYDFHYEFDDRVELVYDFVITGKTSNYYDVKFNFFNLDDKFFVLIEIFNSDKKIEKKLNFKDFLAVDFDSYLVQILQELTNIKN